ncbi:MAG: hypothetical protein GXY23_12795 [Myxococcales bacterium]|nr:hypothetical protein [Myxococcales bacterium]
MVRSVQWLMVMLAALAVQACGGSGGDEAEGDGGGTRFSVGGRLTGLSSGRTLTLRLNGEHELVLDHTASEQAYDFDVELPVGSTYEVTMAEQPVQHVCTIENATGIIPEGGVMDVDVSCTGFALISAGVFHTLAIKADGTLWSWGGNPAGTSLVQVGTDADWTAVAAGYLHSIALKADGTLWS